MVVKSASVQEDAMECNVMLAHKACELHQEESALTVAQADKTQSCPWHSLGVVLH